VSDADLDRSIGFIQLNALPVKIASIAEGPDAATLRVVYSRTVIWPKACQVMTDDSESAALRPTVVDGQRQEDDYEVIWRGLTIGGIMKPPSDAHWPATGHFIGHYAFLSLCHHSS
jgi:hypothetical protein